MIHITKATLEQLPQVATLFNEYRIFYDQKSNLQAATKFLKERISKNESILFLAYQDQKAVGFTQLYTSFSSVSLQPLFILNDLFVKKEYRANGIGEALLNQAKTFCRINNYKGLALETAIDNPAQQLYEKLDWKKDKECFHYFWSCD